MQTQSTERFIICGGNGIEPWCAADEIFKMDHHATVEWIASGELTSIAQVIGFDLTTGKCRDATKDIARDVMERWAVNGDPLKDWQYEFVELHVSMQAARSFRREEEFA